MSAMPHLDGHPPCLAAGEHVCRKPSGRPCVDCGRSAGTDWGPLWCPDCDSRRLARIAGQLRDLGR